MIRNKKGENLNKTVLLILALLTSCKRQGNLGRVGEVQSVPSMRNPIQEAWDAKQPDGTTKEQCLSDDHPSIMGEAIKKLCGGDPKQGSSDWRDDNRLFECETKQVEPTITALRNREESYPHTCGAIIFGCPSSGTHLTCAPGLGCVRSCNDPKVEQEQKNLNQALLPLLDSDPGWIALQKKQSCLKSTYCDDSGTILGEFSPEWKQIQAEIDKEVASINNPDLRADERRRVSERLLPKEKSDRLRDEALENLDKQQSDYLNAHKDAYREIASFPQDSVAFSGKNESSSISGVQCEYPYPVMKIYPDAKGDGVLFYKHEWRDETIGVTSLIRLTVKEMDSVLTKFRSLKEQEISQSFFSDRVRAELELWRNDIILAAQADMAKDGLLSVRPSSPIYLVDKTTGTIVTEVPRAAFCDVVKKSVNSRETILHDCSLDPREPQEKADARTPAPQGTQTVDQQPGAQPSSDKSFESGETMNNSAALDQPIRETLDKWVQSFRNKDARMQAECYAPVVETYFRWHNVTREQLLHDKKEAFAAMGEIRKYNISDIHISLGRVTGSLLGAGSPESRADVTFQKDWDTSMTNGKTFAGKEIEKLTLANSSEGWKIVGEQEMKILNVVRESAPKHEEQQPASQPQSPNRSQIIDGMEVVHAGGGVSAPKPIYTPDPEYSDEARKAGYQGTCELQFIVGTDGLAHNIQVIRSLGKGLDEKAIEATQKWKFEPAMKDGRPVAVQLNVEEQFRLY